MTEIFNFKRLSFFAVLFLLTIAFIQCKKDEPIETTGALTLNFSLRYDGQDITLFTDKKDYMGDTIIFTRFASFLSHGQLKADENKITLFDLAFIDFNNSSNNVALLLKEDIPEGTYDNIEFFIGLDSLINATMPIDHDPASPLSKSDLYWDAWKSYVFSKTEGKIDVNGDLSSFAYHTGGNDAYRIVTFNHDIQIKGGKTTSINFIIDLKEIFRQGDSYYDLLELKNLHNEGQQDDMNRVADNIVRAISIAS